MKKVRENTESKKVNFSDDKVDYNDYYGDDDDSNGTSSVSTEALYGNM